MHCEPLSKVRNSRLSTRVCGDLGKRSICIHRRDVKNATSLSAEHLRSKCLSGNESTEEVEVEYKSNTRCIKVEEALSVGIDVAKLKVFLVGGRLGVFTACAVYKYVAVSEISLYSLGNRVAYVLVKYVTSVSLGNSAFSGDLVGKLLCRLLIKVEKRNLCA